MDNYLVPLSDIGPLQADLSENDVIALQLKLFQLLTRRTGLYTMGDSSSVRVETAQELLASICFLLRLHMKESGLSPQKLLSFDAEEIFADAIRTVERKIQQGKKLYKTACLSIPDIENVSLIDTLRGIGTFFKRYNYRFFAHQTPGDIDYQLCNAMPETMKGVEYIVEYLRRLIIENDLLRHFRENSLIGLLSVYCPGYKDLLINLYEPVLTNAVGLALIGMDVYQLNISDADRSSILKLFESVPRKDAEALLRDSAESLSHQLEIRNAVAKEYMTKAAVNLYPRIEVALTVHSIDGIFISW